ncbi:Zinc finger, C2H2 domain containing protein [Trema orientale]|uniref:Zinc finger, C2H2 domain containing protein n=1 Tax=Trema orientale TaxID=63057 RepID=A0A2P5ASL1_TREOI|nr:Zinc finger, C2H2 domain containing protein [Trema orientale]
MAPNIASLFTKYLSHFFLLFLHLGCFVFTTTTNTTDEDLRRHGYNDRRSSKKRKTQKALSSSWSFIKGIFSSKSRKTSIQTHPSTPPRSSQHSIVSLVNPEPSDHLSAADPPRKKSSPPPESDIAAGVGEGGLFFPLRNDIFPCTACGEIFQKPQLLEQHQAVKHAVSELHDGDSGKNIVRIIFKSGWTDTLRSPVIHRVLKIHNGSKILTRFEEYREAVKSKAARNGAVTRTRDERCIADGNELLRFHCSTFLCDLGANGNSGICNHQYCSVCGIIKSGFSPKLDGISTLSSSWRAHVAIPEEIEEEFRFMNVKRAMLVCRVVAGRVGSESDDVEKEEGGGFDSVLGRSGSGVHTRLDEEELLVFNPRAVLPCFVIVYTV